MSKRLFSGRWGTASRVERLTLAAGMVGVAAANVAIYDATPPWLVLGISAVWVAAIFVLSRLTAAAQRFFSPNVQAALMCAATIVPLLRVVALGVDGRIDALLMESLRNLCAASALFAFDHVRRRATLFSGMLLVLFVFTLDGSLIVVGCVLAQLLIVTLWLVANDQEPWRERSTVPAAPWRLDFMTSCILLVLGGFVAATLLYPTDQRRLGQTLDELLRNEHREANAVELRRELDDQSAALDKAAQKKYGAADDDDATNDRANQKSDISYFSTQRTLPPEEPSYQTLFQLAGQQVRHIPTTQFDQFDGRKWRAEANSIIPRVTGQIADQEGLLKLVNRNDLDFSEFQGDVDVGSQQFLEQFRS
ncbi:MAG: hypothetical protein ACIALR_03535, partial [Blastopirellula sp. JB062]